VTCHNCRIDCQRFGKHRNGLQRFRCNHCGKSYTEPHEHETSAQRRLITDTGLLAIKLICEGNSIRSASRITGLHHRTIQQMLIAAGERCEAMLSATIRGIPAEDVQCDEIWGFVQKKQRNKRGGESDFAYIGNAWTFVAIERHTKLVLAYHLGKRTVGGATRFMRKLSTATDPKRKFQLTTDGLSAYSTAIGNVLGHQGERVDYAQLVKIYALDVPEDARRYSPPRLAEAIPTPIYGDPDEKKICTSHVERQNLTMRMCMRRLTRLTNAFSKKWENLDSALSLHFAYYNFCRGHQTLKGATPAMASGIADRPWTLEEILNKREALEQAA
jgi:transposase-like protein/IS1 family transposase